MIQEQKVKQLLQRYKKNWSLPEPCISSIEILMPNCVFFFPILFGYKNKKNVTLKALLA